MRIEDESMNESDCCSMRLKETSHSGALQKHIPFKTEQLVLVSYSSPFGTLQFALVLHLDPAALNLGVSFCFSNQSSLRISSYVFYSNL